MSDLVIIAELLLYLWPFIVLPAALLVWIRPAGRLACFLLGLIFYVAANHSMGPSGPDSPALIIPFFGFALSAGALLAEAAARLFRAARRLRRRDEA